MNSLPTVTDYYEMSESNKKQFMEVLEKCDPDLYYIKHLLNEYKVNPRLMPPLIRAIYNLAIGSGYGKVQLFMENGIVTAIKPEESNLVNVKSIQVKERVTTQG